jgi:hypothetical protein
MATATVTHADMFSGGFPNQGRMDTNDADILSFINTHVVQKNGTPSFTAAMVNSAENLLIDFIDPFNVAYQNLGITKKYVDDWAHGINHGTYVYETQDAFDETSVGGSGSWTSNGVLDQGPINIPVGATSCFITYNISTFSNPVVHEIGFGRSGVDSTPLQSFGGAGCHVQQNCYGSALEDVHQFQYAMVWNCTSFAGTQITFRPFFKSIAGTGQWTVPGQSTIHLEMRFFI